MRLLSRHDIAVLAFLITVFAAIPVAVVVYMHYYCTVPRMIATITDCDVDRMCVVEYDNGDQGIEFSPRVGDIVAAPNLCR